MGLPSLVRAGLVASSACAGSWGRLPCRVQARHRLLAEHHSGILLEACSFERHGGAAFVLGATSCRQVAVKIDMSQDKCAVGSGQEQ